MIKKILLILAAAGLITFGAVTKLENVKLLDESAECKKYAAESEIVLSETKETLNATTDKLLKTQDELTTTKSELESVQVELTSYSTTIEELTGELNQANNTLNDLTSDEYEMVCLGEFRITYYCDERYEHICGYGIGQTASGKPTEVGWTAAADWSVLPKGSIIYIPGLGFREVQDVGGGVKGKHIDVLMTTHQEALSQPFNKADVWVLVKKN